MIKVEVEGQIMPGKGHSDCVVVSVSFVWDKTWHIGDLYKVSLPLILIQISSVFCFIDGE